ncbi:Acyl-phosphate:glycerol-3-phosphate O-acyltransferase PlsY [Hyphomicrobium sulfonivorans]|uniref:Glycerol-3-phosphate acyltransferase n=1 Tax=Hyphomicrobium sulfonivorans TaxID=121290 RepID=A0A109BKK5_HYPSL|nr:glycerol-3-phosphate 1-O-acyltransferase PlsY [Hyphomicrobium sulfonivorans]KWT70541.1 Acyl-phosphate:glycerol-3-phosphate O-acyltransferase PlsY [Hyphomicrobium sulfonivorans]
MDVITSPFTLAAVALGYLLGSIPFGLLLTRAAGLGDVRKIGSGNIGATNVLRTGNKRLAALTLVLDALKGTAAVLIGRWLGDMSGNANVAEIAPLLAGLAAFLGHIFPVWLGFRGGKGVATFIGVLLGVDWRAALAFCAIWLLVAALTRYSSLSALVAAVAVPVGMFIMGQHSAAILAGLLSLMLIAKHHANIRRLLAGEEPRIGARE